MTEYGGISSLLANAEHRKTSLQDVDVGRGWGGFEVVRDIVLYRQNRQGTIVLLPECFEQPGKWKAARLEFAKRCGQDVCERLMKLLEESGEE